MTEHAYFVFNGILLGVALAMDAFSVSIVNGLNESKMSRKKTLIIPITFAFFQFLMPLSGWVLVNFLLEVFKGFQRFIPVTALCLLLYIGIKMILESVRKLKAGDKDEEDEIVLTPVSLILQGIATSIDALSVGFTISDYNPLEALSVSFIIAIVTFIICVTGIVFGKRIGSRISHGAGILGGMILIFIGIRIFVTGIC